MKTKSKHNHDDSSTSAMSIMTTFTSNLPGFWTTKNAEPEPGEIQVEGYDANFRPLTKGNVNMLEYILNHEQYQAQRQEREIKSILEKAKDEKEKYSERVDQELPRTEKVEKGDEQRESIEMVADKTTRESQKDLGIVVHDRSIDVSAAPAPTKDTAPAPTKDAAPAPTKDTAPAPTKDTAPAPTKDTASAPTKDTVEKAVQAPLKVTDEKAVQVEISEQPSSDADSVSVKSGRLSTKNGKSRRFSIFARFKRELDEASATSKVTLKPSTASETAPSMDPSERVAATIDVIRSLDPVTEVPTESSRDDSRQTSPRSQNTSAFACEPSSPTSNGSVKGQDSPTEKLSKAGTEDETSMNTNELRNFVLSLKSSKSNDPADEAASTTSGLLRQLGDEASSKSGKSAQNVKARATTDEGSVGRIKSSRSVTSTTSSRSGRSKQVSCLQNMVCGDTPLEEPSSSEKASKEPNTQANNTSTTENSKINIAEVVPEAAKDAPKAVVHSDTAVNGRETAKEKEVLNSPKSSKTSNDFCGISLSSSKLIDVGASKKPDIRTNPISPIVAPTTTVEPSNTSMIAAPSHSKNDAPQIVETSARTTKTGLSSRFSFLKFKKSKAPEIKDDASAKSGGSRGPGNADPRKSSISIATQTEEDEPSGQPVTTPEIPEPKSESSPAPVVADDALAKIKIVKSPSTVPEKSNAKAADDAFVNSNKSSTPVKTPPVSENSHEKGTDDASAKSNKSSKLEKTPSTVSDKGNQKGADDAAAKSNKSSKLVKMPSTVSDKGNQKGADDASASSNKSSKLVKTPSTVSDKGNQKGTEVEKNVIAKNIMSGAEPTKASDDTPKSSKSQDHAMKSSQSVSGGASVTKDSESVKNISRTDGEISESAMAASRAVDDQNKVETGSTKGFVKGEETPKTVERNSTRSPEVAPVVARKKPEVLTQEKAEILQIGSDVEDTDEASDKQVKEELSNALKVKEEKVPGVKEDPPSTLNAEDNAQKEKEKEKEKEAQDNQATSFCIACLDLLFITPEDLM